MTNYTDRLNKTIQILNRHLPSTTKWVEKFLTNKNKIGLWPNWCFIPEECWIAICAHYENLERLSQFDQAKFIYKIVTWGTWQYTQGIYQLDKSLINALYEMQPKLEEKIPSNVLLRLPEWSIYVATPDFKMNSVLGTPLNIVGFWATLNCQLESKRACMILLFDGAGGDTHLVTVPVDKDFSVDEVLKNNFSPDSEEANKNFVDGLYSAISILLFLCSGEPEINKFNQTSHNTSKNQWQKLKKNNLKIFLPKKAQIWEVGHNIGEEIRKTENKACLLSESSGKHVKTHIRRAHWHGFWKGPRTEQEKREFIYHWIPPMLVGGYK